MSNDGPPPDYPQRSLAAKARAIGNKFIIKGASTTLVVAVAALGGFSLGVSINEQVSNARRDQAWESKFTEEEHSWQNRFEMQMQQYKETEVSCKLTERRLIDLESYALLNGWKVPKDDQHGPLGNMDRMVGDKGGGKK